jgi:alpha-N-arabinofuranosidase
MYYLMVAEAGTSHDHAVTIARSNTITGPYRGNPRNPILTHRHLGLDYPIVNVGHADMVETQTGEWWMVMLASRPYGGYFRNLGRETFMVPMCWEEEWPVVSPGIGRVEFLHPAPDLAEHPWPYIPACDHFEAQELGFQWNFLRTPHEDFWTLTERPGYLRLRLHPQMISKWENPSFIGRRQQHLHFVVCSVMEFVPRNTNEEGGLVLLQNSDFQYRFVSLLTEHMTVIRLIKRVSGEETVLAEKPVTAGRVYMKIEAREQEYTFSFATSMEAWEILYEQADGRILSTDIAGGFVGAYIGMYASSNGQPSKNVADFDWFEYTALNP